MRTSSASSLEFSDPRPWKCPVSLLSGGLSVARRVYRRKFSSSGSETNVALDGRETGPCGMASLLVEEIGPASESIVVCVCETRALRQLWPTTTPLLGAPDSDCSIERTIMAFLDLPIEILCRILSYLPAVDLFIAQRTCHCINKIFTGTTRFQYILRAHINGVDDLLPPDCSFHDRLDLLKQYEKSWNNLQLDKSAEFPINIEAPVSWRFTLQDGYLIYIAYRAWAPKWLPKSGYGYLDLCAATRNKEASWVHIQIKDPDDIKRHLDSPSTFVINEEPDWDILYAEDHYLDLIFSVDHDLVVSTRFCTLPSLLLSVMPDKATVHCSFSSRLNVLDLCLPSLSLLPGHPTPLPRSMSCGFPRAIFITCPP